MCLVSDALRGAGTGCDVFHWHGREHVIRDGAAFYPTRGAPRDSRSGPRDSLGISRDPVAAPRDPVGELRLAGSAMSQLEMVRKLTDRGVLGLPEALTMAAGTPARALGLERELGSLKVGLAADFLALRGKDLVLEGVWIAGEKLL